MHSTIVRYVFDPFIDLITGRNTRKAFTELKETQFFSREELQDYQFKKLIKLISHAYTNVQFYRELFDEHHIRPEDIKCIEDLSKIPTINKSFITNHPNYPDCITAKNISTKQIKFGKTSGTTSVPLRLAKDANTRSYTWAAYWRWLSWLGLTRGDRTARIWAENIKYPSKIKNLAKKLERGFSNTISLNSFDLSEENMTTYAQNIINSKPKRLHGYTSSIFIFAQFIENNGMKLPPLIVTTTAEVLTDENREYFKKIFRGEVYDQYGCGECGSIAFECPSHEGLHITSEHCIVEIDSTNKYENKRTGEAIITDLDNYYMPMIRYKNGDIIEISDNTCSCGRIHPLITKIHGRSIDVLKTPNGRIVHSPLYFTHLLSEMLWDNKYKIFKYQVIQSDINDLLWKIVTGTKPSEAEIDTIKAKVSQDFDGMNIVIEFVDDIPVEKSGKFRYIKSNIKFP